MSQVNCPNTLTPFHVWESAVCVAQRGADPTTKPLGMRLCEPPLQQTDSQFIRCALHGAGVQAPDPEAPGAWVCAICLVQRLTMENACLVAQRDAKTTTITELKESLEVERRQENVEALRAQAEIRALRSQVSSLGATPRRGPY